jgi:MoaA/NifB/PqqE/SkfB family radical SAM enzyme
MRHILGSYKNGDYNVLLLSDGTKIRTSKNTDPKPDKPESIDLKITNRCDMGCPMCHEDSWDKGAHGDIMNLKFVDTLLQGTELAIGGGNPLCHPDLEKFLEKCKERNIICNITVNQKTFCPRIFPAGQIQKHWTGSRCRGFGYCYR